MLLFGVVGMLRGEGLSELNRSSLAAPITESESMSGFRFVYEMRYDTKKRYTTGPSSLTTTASGWKPVVPSGLTVSACLMAILTTPRSKSEETIPGSYKSCSPSYVSVEDNEIFLPCSYARAPGQRDRQSFLSFCSGEPL